MYKQMVSVTLICAALTFLILVRSEKGPKVEVQMSGDSYFEGLRIVSKKSGKTDWTLLAKRADITKDGKEARLSDVEMKLESRGMTVTAAKGLYNMETKDITVEGSLKASNKNYTFTTDHAKINGARGELETSGDVKIEGMKFRLEGKGIQADNNKNKVRVLKDVKATFNR